MGTRMRLARRGMAREASWSADALCWRSGEGRGARLRSQSFTVQPWSCLSVQFPRVAGVADDHEAREEWVCAAERLG